MGETPETDHLLQLQLRTREFEEFEGILRSLEDGDWYTDEDGQSWRWCYDIDANLHRWFLDSIEILKACRVGKEVTGLRGASHRFSRYGWSNGAWEHSGGVSPYKRLERPC